LETVIDKIGWELTMPDDAYVLVRDYAPYFWIVNRDLHFNIVSSF
jgi:hypothetical protein